MMTPTAALVLQHSGWVPEFRRNVTLPPCSWRLAANTTALRKDATAVPKHGHGQEQC
jgi:hypothetical protein